MRYRRCIMLAGGGVLLAALIGIGTGASAQGLESYENRLRTIAERGRSATVRIRRRISVPRKRGGADKETRKKSVSMSFSGVVIRSNGYVATVARPVRNSKQLEVIRGSHRYSAEVVGTDSISNLAVLRTEARDLPALQPVSSPDLRPGSVVVTVGNAYGLDRSISTGVVAGRNRTVRLKGDMETGLLQITASVNPGDQGGPVIGSSGRLIGLVMGTYRRGAGGRWQRRVVRAWRKKNRTPAGGRKKDAHQAAGAEPLSGRIPRHRISPEGLHFAVPSDTVRWVTDQLIENGRVERSWVGIYIRPASVSPEKTPGEKQVTGFRVVGLKNHGPGHRAGLRTGDLITGIDGKPIESVGALRMTVFRSEPGTDLKLTLLRDGERLKRTVTTTSYAEKTSSKSD